MANTWIKTANGNYQTRTERDGKVYLSAPVPYAWAVKLGMALTPEDFMLRCRKQRASKATR